ncbi:MAG TPA: RidA family protein [Thermomicrobiales bacterium]|jgi:reactive intermediate/imine deaminase
MDFTVFNPATVHPTTGYSHAVRMGDLVFVSGQVATNPAGKLVGKGDIRAQTEQVFANLQAVLEAAGSGLDRVGKLTVLVVRLEDRPVIGEIRNRLFAPFGYVPASTLAVVASLANPDWLVEIEAVAAIR